MEDDSLEYIRWRDEIAMKKEIEELKRRNFDAAMYLGLIAQGPFLRHSRNLQVRSLILTLYGDYFRYGINRNNASWFQKQERFLLFNCHESFRLLGLSRHGYKPLVEQWEKWMLVYDRVVMNRKTVQCVSPDIFKFTVETSYVITHRSIQALFPHMLVDPEFMERVVGREIRTEAVITAIFGAENKLLSFQTEAQMMVSWFRLLQDSVLLKRAFDQSFMDSEGIITGDALGDTLSIT